MGALLTVGWKKKRKAMKHYDSIAYIYDLQYSQEQKLKIEVALKNFGLKSESLVLDVGCGTGLLFNYVLEKAKLILGLDISKRILKRAKERIEDKSRVFLVQADADYLPFQNQTFDAIFAITLLQNMPFPARTLEEIKRVAKNQARIVVTGLKKKFSFREFEKLVGEFFVVDKLWNKQELKDYVAVCRK